MIEIRKNNSRNVLYALGASNRTKEQREIHDFYATPYWVTRKLFEKLKEYNVVLPKNIYEPAVGMGHIATVLEEQGHTVLAADIVNRNWKDTKIQDFENCSELPKECSIITNPPYSLGMSFVEKSLSLLEDGQYCIMFLKLTFLEGKERALKMFTQGMNPKYVFIFANRVNCAKGGNFTEENELYENLPDDMKQETKQYSPYGGQVAYFWGVWQKGFNGKTITDWIV